MCASPACKMTWLAFVDFTFHNYQFEDPAEGSFYSSAIESVNKQNSCLLYMIHLLSTSTQFCFFLYH